jgi:hypothetical protein
MHSSPRQLWAVVIQSILIGGILFLPAILCPCLANQEYSVWFVLRIAIILFVIPATFSVQTAPTTSLVSLEILCICFFLPFSVATACLQGVDGRVAIWAEFFSWALLGEILYLFASTPHLPWEIYYPATFTTALTPLVLYYLYWEIWHYELPWLLWITPFSPVYSQVALLTAPWIILGGRRLWKNVRSKFY